MEPEFAYFTLLKNFMEVESITSTKALLDLFMANICQEKNLQIKLMFTCSGICDASINHLNISSRALEVKTTF